MENAPSAVTRLTRIQNGGLVVGIVGVVLLVISVLLYPGAFFQAYLWGYFFWINMALGCLALAMLHDLSGGMWGALTLRFLEAGMSTLPLMAVLFIPILFGLGDLYVWARPEVVAKDALMQQQSAYLNVPFFIGRAVFYFVAWIVCAYFLRKWSLERDQAADPARLTAWLRRLGAVGLLLFGITSSFGAIDWVMSLEPHWYSTVYAAMVVVGGILGAFALLLVFVALMANQPPLSRVTPKLLFNDLGSLLLTWVILWAYLAFSQLLLIYSGNTNQEIPWYIHRLIGGWQWVGLAVALAGFFLPFVFLIFRDVKRNTRLLGLVAALLVFARVVEVYWLVTPAFRPTGFYLDWIDIVAPVGIGGLWIAAFVWNLKGHPIIPLHDRRFIAAAEATMAREGASS